MATLHDVRLTEVKDFGELKAWQGTHSDLLGENFIILSATPIDTQYGTAYVCDIILLNDETNADTESVKFLMGSVAIVHQIEMFMEDLPFAARVEKEPEAGKRSAYYKLVSVDAETLANFFPPTTK